MQVWTAAWRSLDPPALPAARGAVPHGPGISSAQSAGKRGRRGGAGDRQAVGHDRVLAKGAAEGGPGPARGGGPRLALQGVAARPRAQLLALALVALEQGVAALPHSTLRCCPPGRPSRQEPTLCQAGLSALPADAAHGTALRL